MSKHFNFENIDLVSSALQGLMAANPNLGLIKDERVVFSKAAGSSGKKVLVVSGGGSGHEPLHGGFVGTNLLDAAVAGAVFASPSTKQIMSAIVTLGKLSGVKDFLIVVKNYTGDILHFGLAAERAKSLGFNAELAVVEDDVSVGKSNGRLVGRRGLAGTALVHKIAGGASADKLPLEKATLLVKSVIKNLVTIGSSLDHCSIPGREFHSEIHPDELEIGMGIHNEPGVKKIKIPKLADLIDELLKYLLDVSDKERGYVEIKKSDQAVLLINNLGGVSNLELYAIADVVVARLHKLYGISPVRVYVGNFVTSLNGNGFSITLLNASNVDGPVLDYLDLPTDASGWNATNVDWKASGDSVVESVALEDAIKDASSSFKVDPAVVTAMFKGATERITKLEPKITEYDTLAGDGDCGETLLGGCAAISDALKDKKSNLATHLSDPVAVIYETAHLLEGSMGGTSGGLYSIFMSALAVAAKQQLTFDLASFTDSLDQALQALFKYTRARTGDKTLIDALEPFIKELKASHDLDKAKITAIRHAKHTKKLDAKFGRASYVSKEEFKNFKQKSNEGGEDDLEHDDGEAGIPDPGAIGLAALLEGAINAYEA